MFTLADLPFAPTALEPFIDRETILIHHDKHHATYVNKLNELLADLSEFSSYSTDQELVLLMQNIIEIPDQRRQAVSNNLGQVYNHNLYWESMAAPEEAKQFKMSESFAGQIDKFGSYDNFQKLWKEAGLNQFGSGWVWLVANEDGTLNIQKTSNGDNPVFQKAGTPLLVMDVWEHAYYLKYQNKRADYIDNFFEVIDWSKASQRYDNVFK